MTDDASQLARLRVATVTGRLPPDLGEWALRICAAGTNATERRALRNSLLQQAAAAHGGTRWAAARDIHAALQRLRRSEHPITADPFMVYVLKAWQVDPHKPTTLRRVLSVLVD